MPNPTNSLTSRIQGMQIGKLRVPSLIGSYKYHIMFDDMESAYSMASLLSPKDMPSIITSNTRPNMYIVYDPTENSDKQLSWFSWAYNEYVLIENGYYGNNYYLFGSGKIYHHLPKLVD